MILEQEEKRKFSKKNKTENESLEGRIFPEKDFMPDDNTLSEKLSIKKSSFSGIKNDYQRIGKLQLQLSKVKNSTKLEPIIGSDLQDKEIQSTCNAWQSKLRKRQTQINKNNNGSINSWRWRTEEDAALTKLINEHGTKNWCLIASLLASKYKIKGRSRKQCRERWLYHLHPEIFKSPISKAEERIIFQGHIDYGNCWANISKLLTGRTAHTIKNYFYATVRRQLRRVFKMLKKSQCKEPKEITLKYIHQIIKEHNISYNVLDNETVRKHLEEMDDSDDKIAKDSVQKAFCEFHKTEKTSRSKTFPIFQKFSLEYSKKAEKYCLFLKEKAPEICGKMEKGKEYSSKTKEVHKKISNPPISNNELLFDKNSPFNLKESHTIQYPVPSFDTSIDTSLFPLKMGSQNISETSNASSQNLKQSFSTPFSDRDFLSNPSQDTPPLVEENSSLFPDIAREIKRNHPETEMDNDPDFDFQINSNSMLNEHSPFNPENGEVEHYGLDNENSRNHIFDSSISEVEIQNFYSLMNQDESQYSHKEDSQHFFSYISRSEENLSSISSLFADPQ